MPDARVCLSAVGTLVGRWPCVVGNLELLEFLVTTPPVVQEYVEPAVPPEADLRALLEAGAWAFRSPFDGSTARKARREAGR